VLAAHPLHAQPAGADCLEVLADFHDLDAFAGQLQEGGQRTANAARPDDGDHGEAMG
jgi:hypothetical protein